MTFFTKQSVLMARAPLVNYQLANVDLQIPEDEERSTFALTLPRCIRWLVEPFSWSSSKPESLQWIRCTFSNCFTVRSWLPVEIAGL
jgi:hypothetical protein